MISLVFQYISQSHLFLLLFFKGRRQEVRAQQGGAKDSGGARGTKQGGSHKAQEGGKSISDVTYVRVCFACLSVHAFKHVRVNVRKVQAERKTEVSRSVVSPNIYSGRREAARTWSVYVYARVCFECLRVSACVPCACM